MSEHADVGNIRANSDVYFDLTRPDATELILRRYAAGMPAARTLVLKRTISAAIAGGANTVLVEPNYIDKDWRSEHSAFYSKAFKAYQGVTDRLHFLALDEGRGLEAISSSISKASFDYVGYSIMRPLPWAPVGRTMLRPPRPLLGKVQCIATDIVHLYGVRLEVSGSPFISQDSQLTRCAHAVAWQAAYLHHLRFGSPRITSASIAASASLDIVESRPVPSNGLGRSQLGHVLRAAGIAPIVHNAATLPQTETIGSVARRYLLAGFPIIAANDRHSVLVVGQHGKPKAREYIFHDDEQGPYLDTATSGLDSARPWARLIIPVQPKLFVPGEQAESVARYMLTVAARPNVAPSLSRLGNRVRSAGKKLEVRSFPLESTKYKELLEKRYLPESLVAAVRRKSMPRWLWIAEIVDRGTLLSEMVVDATSNPRSRWLLAWLLEGEFLYFNPFSDRTESMAFDPPELAGVVSLSTLVGCSNG